MLTMEVAARHIRSLAILSEGLINLANDFGPALVCPSSKQPICLDITITLWRYPPEHLHISLGQAEQSLRPWV